MFKKVLLSLISGRVVTTPSAVRAFADGAVAVTTEPVKLKKTDPC